MDSIVIFGAGEIGKRVCDEILNSETSENVEIFYYDNDIKKQEKNINQILVLSYSRFIEKIHSRDCGIILASDCWRELFAFCQNLKIAGKIVGIYNSFNFSLNPYSHQVYGQEAEDIYLQDLFEEKHGQNYKGFYVDVGAHHPYRFSNTQWAYNRGWCGINIEPDIRGFELFERARSRDININCGVNKEEKIKTYYKFEESAFNTFEKNEFKGKRIPKEIIKISTRRLDSILNEYKVEKIDFMNIDVEGFEMNVLQSNDWEKYAPCFILVEQRNISIDSLVKSEIYCYLSKIGYECVCKGKRTAIYQKK